jgi:hypothetical protein
MRQGNGTDSSPISGISVSYRNSPQLAVYFWRFAAQTKTPDPQVLTISPRDEMGIADV